MPGPHITIGARQVSKLSTGASANYFPGMEPDGKNIITYKDALVLDKTPEHIVIIGAGAIGVEFAYFYNTLFTLKGHINAKFSFPRTVFNLFQKWNDSNITPNCSQSWS